MKTLLIALLLFTLAACGGGDNKPSANQVTVPADADLKADVMLNGTGPTRTIEVSFYFSKSVPPGDKSAPTVEMIAVEEPTFNGAPLALVESEQGRKMYSAQGLGVRAENLVSMKLNGKRYEGKAMTQTTLPNRSATIVMTAK